MPRMVQRRSRVEHVYAGRVVGVGDTFEVEEQDVEILSRLGRIEPEEGDKVPGYAVKPLLPNQETGYSDRAMRAQTPRQRRNPQ